MSRRLLIPALALGALAVGAPAASAADGMIPCEGLGLPSNTQRIDLRPLADITLSTCGAAATPTPQCTATPISLPLRPLADVTITVCKP